MSAVGYEIKAKINNGRNVSIQKGVQKVFKFLKKKKVLQLQFYSKSDGIPSLISTGGITLDNFVHKL